jgi:hypothetical protein
MRRVLVAVTALLATGGEARADLRSFTQTYEYSTVPQGRTAVELWHTQGRLTWDRDTAQTIEHIVELEHGITDHWDIALYNVFAQTAGGGAVMAEPYHYDETKLETRYRFADRGVWPVDTLVYLELSKDFGQSIYEIEGKVIGARDFGELTVAANAIVEVQLGRQAAETEPEFAWALGATYHLTPKVRAGAETWGSVEEEELALSIGPALSLAAASNFWVTVTAGFGLTDEADAFSARAIIGIEL